MVQGLELCREQLYELSKRRESDQLARALLEEQRKQELDEKLKETKDDLLEKLVAEIAAQAKTIAAEQTEAIFGVLSAAKAERDLDRRSSSPPVKTVLFAETGSAASNALVSRDETLSHAAVPSPPAPRQLTTAQRREPSLQLSSRRGVPDLLGESVSTPSNARGVKSQNVQRVVPQNTPLTERIEDATAKHILRTLEGRDIARRDRRCKGESRGRGLRPARLTNRLDLTVPRSVFDTFKGTIVKSPETASRREIIAKAQVRRSTRVKALGQKKTG